MEGRVILRKIWRTSTASLSTFYVYDDFGNLRCVVPPFPGAPSVVTLNETDDLVKKYCYVYHYDEQNRLVEKRLPGKDWEYIVYNELNQVVLTQDARQRTENKWLFTKYDAFGRVAVTGVYTNQSGRLTLQAAVNDHTNLWESWTGNSYTSIAFPTNSLSYNSVLKYDDYSFQHSSLFSQAGAITDTKGLLTATMTYVDNSPNFLTSVNYYDEYGRIVKNFKQHYASSSVDSLNYDETTYTYNFVGEVKASTRIHRKRGAPGLTIAIAYEYDAWGRKIKTKEKINSDAEVLLSEKSYNEIGGLKDRKLHNGLQSTTYSYNQRSWLKTIRSNEFSEVLMYEDSTTNRQYNGNISYQKWGFSVSTPNIFSYLYDGLNRLTSANSPSLNENITYNDDLGNILTMNRNGVLGTYAYNGNKLSQITSGGLATEPYAYDLNGNMTTDGRNGVTLTYNLMSLPKTIIKSGLSATYLYSSDGLKLNKTSNISGTTVTTHYVDGVQYTGNNIDFIQTEEGIARRNGSSYSYEYNLTDHLGNIRVSLNRNPTTGQIAILQKDNYFAFGKRSAVQGGSNRYLYNGKELQEEIESYDYGARFYDPVIGRWNVIDPLPEKSRRFSPYVYGNNNPIRFTDPDGMEANDIIYKNRQTGKEVGRIILPGDDVVRYTNAQNTQELIANNFDGPQLSQGKPSTPEEVAARAYAYQQSQQVVDYQDISQPTTSLAIAKNVSYTYATEATIAKVAPLVKGLFSGSKGTTTGALDGSFSVSNWSGYPAGGLQPSGPFRLLEGGEYTTARGLANTTNAALRRANPEALKGFQIHEIHPVKYGGSPTEISNKILLTPSEHAKYTNFWNSMMKNLK